MTPCVSRAQKTSASWDGLNALRAGEKVEVVETSLKKYTGTFTAVSEESLTLREGAAEQSIRKEDVMRVTSLAKSRRLRNALIFAAVGAGAGAGIGAAAFPCHGGYLPCATGAVAAVLGLSGFVGGAAIGAFVPSHPTIYRIPAKPRPAPG
jgi:hypothetical protein